MCNKKWIDQIWLAGQVNKGNVVRRKIDSVNKYASIDDLEVDVRKRGYHMAVIGDQYIVICNPSGQIRLVC